MGAALFLRAELFRELEQGADALRWYSVMTGELPVALLYVAPSHLRRAGIHEARGETELAARHYTRFIELWSESDPELRPLVDDARRRLEARWRSP